MKDQVDKQAVIALFAGFRDAFPHLGMELGCEDPDLDLSMDIHEQPGLAFDVNVNLQRDELHLTAGEFWVSWFPCYRADVVKEFSEAVHGVLTGSHRIVEYYRGKRFVKAQLQKPRDGGWKTIATSSKLLLPIPWGIHKRVLQNL